MSGRWVSAVLWWDVRRCALLVASGRTVATQALCKGLRGAERRSGCPTNFCGIGIEARCVERRIVYDITAAEPISEEPPSSYDSKKLYRNNRSRWRRTTGRRTGIALQRERKCRHGFSIRRSEHHAIAGGDGGRTTERKGPGPGLPESH